MKENSLVVAKAMYNMYGEKFHSSMDEMKMHKLMYFTQKESLMYDRDTLFDEAFYGWRFGPVLKSVRSEYKSGHPFADVKGEASPRAKELMESVLDRSGAESSWNLSSLSHDDLSWKLARKGLDAADNGNVPLTVNAMMLDATHELAERKKQQC